MGLRTELQGDQRELLHAAPQLESLCVERGACQCFIASLSTSADSPPTRVVQVLVRTKVNYSGSPECQFYTKLATQAHPQCQFYLLPV